MVGGSANQDVRILSKHDGHLGCQIGLVGSKIAFQSMSKCSDCFC